MIVVVGGRASGKRTFVAQLGYADADCADGVFDACPVLLNLQDLVASELDGLAGHAGTLPSAEQLAAQVDDMAARLVDKEVVVCCEVGSGIVPMDPIERAWREQTGRVLGRLADCAECVVRMVCGIPVALKGTLPTDGR